MLNLPSVEMKYLSMGMTSPYKIAVEEEINTVKTGARTFLFRAIPTAGRLQASDSGPHTVATLEYH